MKEINELQKHISNYSRTKDIYVQYRKSGYSKKFYTEHEGEVILHKASKKFFDEMNLEKLPTIKPLQTEYAKLSVEKNKLYQEYKAKREEMKNLSMAKANIDQILNNEPQKKKEAIER